MAEHSQLETPILVSDTNVSIILGNALDNAIEANEKIDDDKLRKISVQLRSGRGIFSIKITNPVDKNLMLSHGKIKTSKVDVKNHGLGLASIEEIVKNNQGVIEYYCENQIFTLSIFLENLYLDP